MTHLEVGSDTIVIVVNGDPREVPTGSTVATLLTLLELDSRLVVVERNREILRDRDAFPLISLGAGDALEIVHFVGGG